jgi:flagellar assembly protein FliH
MKTCSENARPVALSELEQFDVESVDDPAGAARAIVAAAQDEAGALRAEAVERGYADGVRRGREESSASLAPAAEALRQALDEAIAARDAIVAGAEKRAVQLAIAIAEKVLAGTLEVEPERVADVVRGALRGLLDSERIIVCVNPEDVELVRGSGQQLTDVPIEIHGEQRVPRGGALVRTSVGEIDARIETKLDAVRALVTAELTA